jgi:hypothetical protein
MPMLADLDTRLHILGYASVIIEKAARRGDTLVVETEAAKLLYEFPHSSMSLPELRNRMTRLAAKRGVPVELGGNTEQGA